MISCKILWEKKFGRYVQHRVHSKLLFSTWEYPLREQVMLYVVFMTSYLEWPKSFLRLILLFFNNSDRDTKKNMFNQISFIIFYELWFCSNILSSYSHILCVQNFVSHANHQKCSVMPCYLVQNVTNLSSLLKRLFGFQKKKM